MRLAPVASTTAWTQGYKSLNFDYRSASTQEIVDRVRWDPVERRNFLESLDAEIHDMGQDVSEDNLAERYARNVQLREQIDSVKRAVAGDDNPASRAFSEDLSRRWNESQSVPVNSAHIIMGGAGDTVVRDLGTDRSGTVTLFGMGIALHLDMLRNEVAQGTADQEDLAKLRDLQEKIKYVERNDPVQDASSQPFHSHLDELYNESKALEAQVEALLGPERWQRG